MLLDSCYSVVVIVIFGLITGIANAQPGQSCTTPNDELAQCISIYKCDILYNSISQRNRDQEDFLRASQCGYQEVPYVCCGTVASFQTSTKMNLGNNLLPSRNSCGFQEGVRILGGTKTGYDEFPWVVLLEYKKNSGGTTFSCGGALISKRYVLTAAHCVTGQINDKVGPLYSVRLGEWNTETEVDCTTVKNFNVCNDAPVDVLVQSFVAHPEYDDSSINRYHDIALVRLAQQVAFTQFIQPICLPSPAEHAAVASQLWVSGWGRTEYANFSPIKLKVKIPIVSNTQCADTFQKAKVSLSNTQLCAGGERNKDSCNGDSGGPLMHTTTNDTSQWYAEGVVSFGTRCGTENWPGIYTRVSAYLPWIYQNVKS